MVLRAGLSFGKLFGMEHLKPTRESHRLCAENPGLLEEYDDSRNGKLKALRDTLNEKLGVLSDLDSSILNQVEDEEIEKEIAQSSELNAEIEERANCQH